MKRTTKSTRRSSVFHTDVCNKTPQASAHTDRSIIAWCLRRMTVSRLKARPLVDSVTTVNSLATTPVLAIMITPALLKGSHHYFALADATEKVISESLPLNLLPFKYYALSDDCPHSIILIAVTRLAGSCVDEHAVTLSDCVMCTSIAV